MTDPETVSRAATEWLIALQEQPDDAALRLRFEAWRAATPGHAAAWVETEMLGGLLAKAMASRVKGLKPRRRTHVVGLAALALAACVAVLVLPNVMLRWSADAVTATAELRTITLPDGSTVVLAPESAIAVAFDGHRRLVRLLAGRAFFEVAHDAEYPFVVAARQVETTVTGTAFDVRLADAGVEVAVQRGQVRVEDAAASPPVRENLGAGDWLQVEGTGSVHRLQQPAPQWQQGQLVAIDRPVGDVVAELRAYFPGRILVTSDALAEKRVTGVYDLHDPAAALRALATAHGAKVQALSDWILILSGG